MSLNSENSPDIATENESVEVNVADPLVELNSEKHQEARAFLRERYLRAITFLVGHSCKFSLVDNKHVTGILSGSDTESKHFYVKDLVTPIGALPDALLRSEDIVSFRISGISI